MSVDSNVPGEQIVNPVEKTGEKNLNIDKNTDPSIQPEDKIDYAKYRQLLDEKKKIQQALEEKSRREAELSSKLTSYEEEKMKEEKRFKELFEARDNELKKIKDQMETERKAFNEAKKVEAFLRASGGLKNNKYKNFIDTDKILIGSSGDVDDISLTEYVEEFRKSYGELLAMPAKKVTPSQEAPKVDSLNLGSLNSSDLLKKYIESKGS